MPHMPDSLIKRLRTNIFEKPSETEEAVKLIQDYVVFPAADAVIKKIDENLAVASVLHTDLSPKKLVAF